VGDLTDALLRPICDGSHCLRCGRPITGITVVLYDGCCRWCSEVYRYEDRRTAARQKILLQMAYARGYLSPSQLFGTPTRKIDVVENSAQT
jgi:predicted nucleic acid-binding Zn ribbon protein